MDSNARTAPGVPATGPAVDPVLVLGEALVDLVVSPDGSVAAVPGGGPYTTARTLARLGTPVAYAGPLSGDALGGLLRRGLLDDGVALLLPDPVPEPTTLAIATLDAGGAASYRFLTDGTSAAALEPGQALALVAAGTPAMHVGTLGLVLRPLADAVTAAVEAAPVDCLVMADPNCRPAATRDRAAYAATVARVFDRADVVKVSGDDLDYLAPGVPAAKAAEAIARRHGCVVLLTDGAAAVHVVGPWGSRTLKVPRVPVVDTVGAGDAFSGGFLARWLETGLAPGDLGNPHAVVAAAEFGIRVAALTCQRPGADPPRRDEVPG